MKPVLLDTGVIIALLNRNEAQHVLCVDRFELVRSPVITCEPVITEACHLLHRFRGAAEAILDNVSAGIFQIPFQLSHGCPGVRRILLKYRDHHIDLADACLIHLAEEFETGEILTRDSDFGFYRWGKNKPFHNLIPLS